MRRAYPQLQLALVDALAGLETVESTEVRSLSRHLRVQSVLEVDGDVATIYADILVDLRRAGTPVPTNDVWIGATAVRAGASVVTYDAHFDKMRRVSVRLLGG